MIQKEPGLLLEKALVCDYSGRWLEGTALQLALGAGNVSLNTVCHLVTLATPPTNANLDDIPISGRIKTAYVISGSKLFYLDRANDVCTEIPINETALKQLTREMRPNKTAKPLTKDQLKQITALTSHIHEEGLADMLMRHLKNLPQGKEIIAAQICEQFPAGWIEQEMERQQKDFAAVNKVFSIIADANDDDTATCEAAVTEFKKYLDQQKNEAIKKGKHSNLHLLVRACKLNYEHFERFGDNCTSYKNKLCWDKIIGSIQCYLTACDAQMLCQDFHELINGRKLKYSLEFRHLANTYFYPLNHEGNPQLGEDCAATEDGYIKEGLHLDYEDIKNLWVIKSSNEADIICEITTPDNSVKNSRAFA